MRGEAFARAFHPDRRPVLSMYTTVGFPTTDDTVTICEAFERAGAGMIELGMPYSDPIADGPVLQAVNARALAGGVTVGTCLDVLAAVTARVSVPVVLMGYLNPVVRYGPGRFLAAASRAGAAGVILPDLPLGVFEREYAALYLRNGLEPVFLVTSETSEGRIRRADALSESFLYLVSSRAVTGGAMTVTDERRAYLARVRAMGLKNPLVVGFGIDGPAAFDEVTRYADGAIVASAVLRAIGSAPDPAAAAGEFTARVLGGRRGGDAGAEERGIDG